MGLLKSLRVLDAELVRLLRVFVETGVWGRAEPIAWKLHFHAVAREARVRSYVRRGQTRKKAQPGSFG